MAVDPHTPAEATPAQLRRAVLAGVVGNYAEQYEFGVYAALSTVLASVFFPSDDPALGLLATYAGLALGFVVRPLGGIIFGQMGDRLGRKRILSLTIIIMGFLTFLIGLIPSYAQIGVTAPILLLLLRLGQGLAAGGEYAGAVSFVVEYGPGNQRARYTSFVSISVFAGLLTGTALTFGLSALLGPDAMASWGWRIPFLLALPLTFTGFYLRRAVEDTPEFRRQQAQFASTKQASEEMPSVPLREVFRTQGKAIGIFSGFAITNAVLSYTWTGFIPGYLRREHGLSLGTATLSTSIALLAIIPLLYASGRLSDRIGRRPMLLAATALTPFVVPLAFWIISHGGFGNAVLAQLIYLVPLFFIAVSVTVCLAEMFPTRVRYSSGGIAFNIAFAFFAGTAPLIADWLVLRTGTIMSVAAYVAGISCISFVVVLLFYRETYRKDLADDDYNPPSTLAGASA
ncbi:MFS transporter [Arsenicicoccus sp. oral taxon 190]|nr:MFS transporter [Arsenicicoccus sp. oral taxon 190]